MEKDFGRALADRRQVGADAGIARDEGKVALIE
jgi:hypothetical protein